MALQKSKISLPLSLGLNTKSDDKQQPPGTFRVLENAVYDEPGKLKKRNGYDEVSLVDTVNTTIANPKQLATFRSELNLFTDTDLYSYAPTVDQWSNKGSIFTVLPESTQVLRNARTQSNVDSTHLEGLNIFTYEDSDGVHFSIMDNKSKSFLVNKQLVSASGLNAKVVHRDNKVYIFYTETNTIKYIFFNIFDFDTISTPATIVTAQNALFDIELIADRIQIAYNSTTSGGTLTLQGLQVDNSLTSAVEVTGEFASTALTVNGDATNRILIAYYDGTDVKSLVYNYNLGDKIVVETSLETIALVKTLSIIESSTDIFTVIYEIGASSTSNHYIKTNTIDTAASVGTPSTILRSLALASKMFIHDNEIYFATLHDNTLQSTIFLVDINGTIISKISPNTAGNVITNGTLPRIAQISTLTHLLTSQIKGRLTQDNGTFFSLLGVNSTILDFETEFRYDNKVLGRNLHIAGGYLKMYDGAITTEHGFHLFPESLTDGGNSTTGGTLSDGTYGYTALYSWIDSQGLIHKSAPSLQLSLTLSGGTSTQQQTINIPALRLTDKENVQIELYRTEDAGTISYLISSTDNDKTVDSVSIIDNSTSDTDLISNEILYTTGGVLDNTPAPPSSIIESFKNRIFLTTPMAEKLSYSKIRNESFPVEFNDSLELVIPSEGGNNVAMKSMDDKLIIFKRDAIYYLSGDGPNNIGEQDTFIEPELISSEIGCSNRLSTILTPSGIFFKSDKGIYLLTRSLSLQYIGAPVEEFNNLNIVSADMISDKNQIRFTTSDGDCLVYNYFQNKWSTFANHKALSATTLDGDYYYIRPDSLLYKENSTFNDNGSSIKLKLESGWLSFAGVQGFQRVYRLLLLGAFKSSHKIRIKVAYNYIDAWTEDVIIDTADFINSTTYGEESPYGSSETYGAANLNQIRLDFSRQKCQSIKISIEDLQDSTGEALDLSNILFVVGAKSSEAKTDESTQYGSS